MLRSSIREFLASEALYHLVRPTLPCLAQAAAPGAIFAVPPRGDHEPQQMQHAWPDATAFAATCAARCGCSSLEEARPGLLGSHSCYAGQSIRAMLRASAILPDSQLRLRLLWQTGLPCYGAVTAATELHGRHVGRRGPQYSLNDTGSLRCAAGYPHHPSRQRGHF